jgi:hypothetical protein
MQHNDARAQLIRDVPSALKILFDNLDIHFWRSLQYFSNQMQADITSPYDDKIPGYSLTMTECRHNLVRAFGSDYDVNVITDLDTIMIVRYEAAPLTDTRDNGRPLELSNL